MNIKQVLTLSLILLLLPALAVSCIGTGVSVGAPVINSFNANPSSINSGDTAILDWNVSNASSVVIDQGVGTVNASGTTTVTPSATTTYTVTAVNTSGSATKTVTVAVSVAESSSETTSTTTITTTTGSLPVIFFSISPTGITPKGSALLSWSVSNADSISIDNGIGAVASSGSRSVSPDVTTNYTMTASNSYGTTTNMVRLVIAPAGSTAPPYLKDWVGSKHTREYHYPSCSIAQNITPVNKVWFNTTMEAQAAGYHPCPVCHPPH